jgi:hypothetical protein
MGTTRYVDLFDNCPSGFSASFLPIQRVKITTPLTNEGSLVMKLPFYQYSFSDGQAYYERKQTNETSVVEVMLDGPTPGYEELSGTYTGTFQYGSTRRRYVSPSILGVFSHECIIVPESRGR